MSIITISGGDEISAGKASSADAKLCNKQKPSLIRMIPARPFRTSAISSTMETVINYQSLMNKNKPFKHFQHHPKGLGEIEGHQDFRSLVIYDLNISVKLLRSLLHILHPVS